MKLIVTILLLLMAPHAYASPAAPPCWPKQIGGTGGAYKRGQTPLGQWLGWQCAQNGRTVLYGVVALKNYRIINPPVAGLTHTQAALAYWNANVTAYDPQLDPLRDAMEAAFK